jgi:hypothetical protein
MSHLPCVIIRKISLVKPNKTLALITYRRVTSFTSAICLDSILFISSSARMLLFKSSSISWLWEAISSRYEAGLLARISEEDAQGLTSNFCVASYTSHLRLRSRMFPVSSRFNLSLDGVEGSILPRMGVWHFGSAWGSSEMREKMVVCGKEPLGWTGWTSYSSTRFCVTGCEITADLSWVLEPRRCPRLIPPGARVASGRTEVSGFTKGAGEGEALDVKSWLWDPCFPGTISIALLPVDICRAAVRCPVVAASRLSGGNANVCGGLKTSCLNRAFGADLWGLGLSSERNLNVFALDNNSDIEIGPGFSFFEAICLYWVDVLGDEPSSALLGGCLYLRFWSWLSTEQSLGTGVTLDWPTLGFVNVKCVEGGGSVPVGAKRLSPLLMLRAWRPCWCIADDARVRWLDVRGTTICFQWRWIRRSNPFD